MTPTSFPESNNYFDKPNDMTEEQCGVLSTFQGNDINGLPVIISCWKPSKEELEEINRTGRVWVFHYGGYLQPHAVSGTNPFIPTK